jgi:hypothetical protein
MSKIKTFRGLMADRAQETIHLSTITGTTGYRIKKFQIITAEPGNSTQDLVVKIFKVEQDSVPSTATIDLADNTLLAVAHYSQSTTYYNQYTTIIFENEIFNQDIFVTSTDNDGSDPCNYYLELEQVKLDSNETAVATLKNIKNRG